MENIRTVLDEIVSINRETTKIVQAIIETKYKAHINDLNRDLSTVIMSAGSLFLIFYP